MIPSFYLFFYKFIIYNLSWHEQGGYFQSYTPSVCVLPLSYCIAESKSLQPFKSFSKFIITTQCVLQFWMVCK
jgi:hypothetical protein